MTKTTPYLIHHLKTHYGLIVTSLKELSLGADLEALTFKADTSKGHSYFIKLRKGFQPDIGAEIVSWMESSGIREVIAPLKTLEGHLAVSLNNFTLTVYPFIEGENGFTRPLSETQWMTLGRVLKQIHTLKVPAALLERIKTESYTSPWRQKVRSLEHLSNQKDEIALKLQSFMIDHKNIIQRLVDHAEALHEEVKKCSPQFVLCHSDLHGGNILVNEKGFLYIVDWDAPIFAPKERDLMFIGGGVANILNPHEEEYFYRGYGTTPLNQTLLAYYRYERIIEDLAIYGEELLLKNQEPHRLEIYKLFTDQFQPGGVIDIAFKTDSPTP